MRLYVVIGVAIVILSLVQLALAGGQGDGSDQACHTSVQWITTTLEEDPG